MHLRVLRTLLPRLIAIRRLLLRELTHPRRWGPSFVITLQPLPSTPERIVRTLSVLFLLASAKKTPHSAGESPIIIVMLSAASRSGSSSGRPYPISTDNQMPDTDAKRTVLRCLQSAVRSICIVRVVRLRLTRRSNSVHRSMWIHRHLMWLWIHSHVRVRTPHNAYIGTRT